METSKICNINLIQIGADWPSDDNSSSPSQIIMIWAFRAQWTHPRQYWCKITWSNSIPSHDNLLWVGSLQPIPPTSAGVPNRTRTCRAQQWPSLQVKLQMQSCRLSGPLALAATAVEVMFLRSCLSMVTVCFLAERIGSPGGVGWRWICLPMWIRSTNPTIRLAHAPQGMTGNGTSMIVARRKRVGL